MSLSSKTILKRCADMTLVLRPDGSIRLNFAGRSYAGGIHTLALLDLFSTTRTFTEGVDLIRTRLTGNQAWLEATKELRYLYEIGALVELNALPVELPSHPGRFDAFPVHLRMLFDEARTLSFQQAIRETVKPSDIVVDIGTGSGVLAVTAAMAGAKHVYAVERSNIGHVARALFEANGLSDRITLIEGKSTEVELPERADVMISEIIGNDPLQEGVLPTTHDAVKRLLKPDARLIPGRLRICALPVSVPEKVIKRQVPGQASMEYFQHLYGIDFSPLWTLGSQQPHSFFCNTHQAKDWLQLGDPVVVADIDLGNPPQTLTPSHHRLKSSREGVLNGILIYFELEFGAGKVFSIHPSQATSGNHWGSKVWVPAEPPYILSGDQLDIVYRYDCKSGSSIELQSKGA